MGSVNAVILASDVRQILHTVTRKLEVVYETPARGFAEIREIAKLIACRIGDRQDLTDFALVLSDSFDRYQIAR